VDPTPVLFQTLGISLLLGLLVGLQREHTGTSMVGMRTFPLITVLGTVSAMLASEMGGWIVAAGLLGVVAVIGFANRLRLEERDFSHGTTTAVAALLMFGVGAFLALGPMEVAIAIGGGVAVLLQFKPELHGFAKRLGDQDLKAIMQFVLITCIILPVLPNRPFGPLAVLNPREIWLMVVLIVGMSLGGYIVYKFLGRDTGILLGGFLGGAISSTATTASYGRLSRVKSVDTSISAIVIMIASTIVFVRVLVEIAVVAPDFLHAAATPVVILMLLTGLPAFFVWIRVRRHPSQMPEQENPTQLKSAVLFGLMYAVVIFALAGAEHLAASTQKIGDEALYVVAGLSGMTDMDAITLATARRSRADPIIATEGWRLVIVAALANLVFKAGLVGLIGSRRLFAQIILLFSVPLIGGIILLLVWRNPW